MENSESITKQLIVIKWLLIFMVSCVVITTSAIVFFSFGVSNSLESSLADKSCGENDFSGKVSDLIDRGKTEEAIKLANERLKSYPNDQDGYWYRGLAFYIQKEWQLAIADFNKTEELAPSWK